MAAKHDQTGFYFDRSIVKSTWSLRFPNEQTT